MVGWVIPPPKRPEKTKEEFSGERVEKVKWLISEGFLRSEGIIKAMLKVPREDFTAEMYRDYAYLEVPLPIPGREATISCPHSYPLFYEALGLKEGENFLEVGTGSGYGAVLAREVVGSGGKVVTVEIDEETYKFAKENIEKLGYKDILLILGDGSLGYSLEAPYDKICITATCPRIPDPLIRQLRPWGRLIAPLGHPNIPQDLILLTKRQNGSLESKVVEKVIYVPLRGEHGWSQ